MKKILLLLCALGALSQFSAKGQVLLAGFDFQTTTFGGTAAAAAPSSPSVFLANVGTQAGVAGLYLNGTNGSSTWITATTGNQVTAFGGTAINATGGMSTVTSGSSALALLGGTSNAANGKAIVFTLNMSAVTDLSISYAVQKTATGFGTEVWSYSLDGTTFTDFSTQSTIPTAFAKISLPTITGVLDGDSSVFIKVTFTGATSSSGNNRLDNVTFTAVPEPHEYGIAIAGMLVTLVVVRRRRANSMA